MVLLSTLNRSVKGLPRGEVSRTCKATLTVLTVNKTIFNLCNACESSMSCIPPSAFSARRIRETQQDQNMKVSNTSKTTQQSTKFFDAALELTPVKYNSKLMNSIWGFYNRYSPHNVKKINDVFRFNGEMQQNAASPKDVNM